MLPTLNVRAEEASLSLAAMVFRTGLLETNDGGDLGWSTVPLGELHGTNGARALASASVSVRLGAKVSAVVADEDGWAVEFDDDVLQADVVIVAGSPAATASLIPEFAPLVDGLGASPIVNVHLLLDRQVTDLPLAAGVGSPVQFVFDRTASSGLERGQYLAISVSGADADIGRSPDDLVRSYHDALGELFPLARRANLLDATVSREHTATFRPRPGTGVLRPGTVTARPGTAARRGLVRHRMAGHHGGGGAQRPGGSGGGTPHGERRRRVGRGAMSSTCRRPLRQQAPEPLSRAAALVAPELERAVQRLAPVLQEPVRHHLAGGGKGIRAALVLVSAAACGAPEEVAIPGAVAIELVHNYSLLHDDIIDGDRERRHRPTVWAAFGTGAGHHRRRRPGHALATEILLEEPTPARVAAAVRWPAATQSMIAGQADDMAFEARSNVSVEECLAMEAGKTGALLAAAAAMGAMLAGAADDVVEALCGLRRSPRHGLPGRRRPARHLGRARPHGQARRAATCLPQEVLAGGGRPGPANGRRSELAELLAGELDPDADVVLATRLIEESGAEEMRKPSPTNTSTRRWLHSDRVDLAPGPAAELEAIARYVIERDR